MKKRTRTPPPKTKKELEKFIREYDFSETKHTPTYASFKKYRHKAPKYTARNKSPRKMILWPFIVILPFFIVSILLQQIPSNSANHTPTQETPMIDIHTLKKEITDIFTSMPHPPPDALQDKIMNNLVLFLQELTQVLQGSTPSLLTLVDTQHKLAPTYVPEELEDLDQYPRLVVNKKNLMLTKETIDHLLIMAKEAERQNITLDVSSAYRSYEYQNTLFTRISESLGSKEASRQSAQPGASQHQLGTTIDFGSIDESFAHTPASKWLEQHAWKYGFSLSYPKDSEYLTGYIYESWHYRYIGIPAAFFEHYYFDSQQYMLEFLHYIPEDSILRTLDVSTLRTQSTRP